MSKFAGFIIGAIEIGIGVATGNVALIVSGAAMIVSQAIVDLTASKQPAREASEMTIALGEQPRVMLVGETFTPGSLADGFDYGGKYGTDWEVLIIRLADHKCHSLTGFYVNDDYNPYTGDGLVSRYDDQFEIYFRADTTTDPLPAIVTTHGPGWTAADIGQSGCDVIVAYKADKQNDKHPGWPGGRPHFGFVVKGAYCYDPRKDDTVVGGSGAHRSTDPTTWEWSENAAICRYKWVRGVYANDVVTDPTALLVGRGLSADEAPPENIIAPANLCDEGIGTSFPYRMAPTAVGGIVFYQWATAGPWMIRWGFDTVEFWSLANFSRVSTVSATFPFVGVYENVAVDDVGNAWVYGFHIGGSLLTKLAYDGTVTNTAAPGGSQPIRALRTPGGVRVFVGASAGGYLDGATLVTTSDASRDFCVDDAGNVWALFQPTGSSNQFTIVQLVGGSTSSGSLTAPATRSGPTEARIAYCAAAHSFMVAMDGHFAIVDRSAWAVTATGAQSWTLANDPLPENRATATTFWDGFSEYSLADGSLIRTEHLSDWGIAGSFGGQSLYDPINNALIGCSDPDIYQLFLDAGGYRVAGPIYANQEFIDVEAMFSAATAGNTVTVSGSVELEPGHAKTSVFSFTDDDLVVGSKVSWNRGFLSQSSDEWVNTVVANYVEPLQRWNTHDAPVMRVGADIVADGKAREAKLPLRLVRHQDQAQRVAEIARRLGRLWGRGTVTLGPRFCEVEDGDWGQWTSARFGGATKTFQVQAYSLDKSWQNTLTLREIEASAYDVASSFTLDRSVASPTTPPPAIGAPTGGNWALNAITLDSAGASNPALEITGSSSDDDYVQAIIVEYWKSDGVTDPYANADAIPWTIIGSFAPDTTRVQTSSVVGLGTYYAAVSYVVDGIPGDRRVLGPVTVADYNVVGVLTLEDNVTALAMEDDATAFNLG